MRTVPSRLRVRAGVAVVTCLLAGCGIGDLMEEMAIDADTARELATNLTEIESTFPEAHRVLSDGTWDSYDLEEKQAFIRRLSIDAHKLDLDLRAEQNADRVRDMREHGLDDDIIEQMAVVSELWELRMIEMDLRRRRETNESSERGVVKVLGPPADAVDP
ncbi:MAG: hypothetical protein F4Y41_15935 [Gammaproteobacteria bacterium]|nr:hypothetical protein [Gammaproteobacteria bacterium]MYF30020.1 hypothetical protein [Gammaproteobacteria bacterium]